MKRARNIPHLWSHLPSLALLLGVLFAFMSAAPASAATITTQNIPINTTLSNPCNGESVTLSGVAHEVSSVTIDGTGQFHLAAHFAGTITGTGSQGNMYVGVLNEQFTRNGSIPGTFTHTFTTKLTSNGSAPNFSSSILEHFTVSADGTTTVSFLNFTATCSG
jgi:hypothetical protein